MFIFYVFNWKLYTPASIVWQRPGVQDLSVLSVSYHVWGCLDPFPSILFSQPENKAQCVTCSVSYNSTISPQSKVTLSVVIWKYLKLNCHILYHSQAASSQVPQCGPGWLDSILCHMEGFSSIKIFDYGKNFPIVDFFKDIQELHYFLSLVNCIIYPLSEYRSC